MYSGFRVINLYPLGNNFFNQSTAHIYHSLCFRVIDSTHFWSCFTHRLQWGYFIHVKQSSVSLSQSLFHSWDLRPPKWFLKFAYIRVHSLCWTFHGFWQVQSHVCTPPLCHTEYFHYCKESLQSSTLLQSSLLSKLLATTDLFTVSSFPKCHINEIMQYVAFSDWLSSLGNMRSRFIHILG